MQLFSVIALLLRTNLFRSRMESNTEESLYSPMLLEMSPDSKPKKRAWPRRLQIPLGLLIVGLVGVSTMCLLSFADSKDVKMVNAGNLSLGDFQERDRRNLLSSGGKRRVPKTIHGNVWPFAKTGVGWRWG